MDDRTPEPATYTPRQEAALDRIARIIANHLLRKERQRQTKIHEIVTERKRRRGADAVR